MKGQEMEKLMEGLKEYRTWEEIDNPYFLDIEYHVLRHNHPDCLLPVQIRDIDGVSRLLYEVTGMHCLADEMSRISFSAEDMRGFLEDFRKMLLVLDQYMLDLGQVCMKPGEIFREKNGRCRFIYSPEKQENTMKRIESLFEWFLSSIDYSDFELIQFTYHAYWCIRNHPFGAETLQKCLDYRAEQAAQYQEASPKEPKEETCGSSSVLENSTLIDRNSHLMDGIGAAGQEDAVKKETAAQGFSDGYPDKSAWDPYGQDMPRHFDYEEKKKAEPGYLNKSKLNRSMILEIVFAVFSGVLFIALAVFFGMGYMHNMLADLKIVLACLLAGVVLCADLAWQMHRKRKRAEEGHVPAPVVKKDTVYPSYNYSWEEEGATEVLGIRKDMLQPAFKSIADGRVHVINEFPYYIGSEEAVNQMIIEGASVSRRHAAVIRGRQTGNYDLQDLRSTNGTWVDQAPVIYEKPVRLKQGSRVRFAAAEYEFVMLGSGL